MKVNGAVKLVSGNDLSPVSGEPDRQGGWRRETKSWKETEKEREGGRFRLAVGQVSVLSSE